MSKKRPTESSWDSDEELLSDTAGISAFPKASELDLLAEDGDLDEEALLGLDETGAPYNNDSMQPMVNRQRSKNAMSVHQEQAFVFEEADTGDLEDDLTTHEMGNEMVGNYDNEEMGSYSHDVYHPNGSGEETHEVSAEADHWQASSDVIPTSQAGDGYDGGETQAHDLYSEDPSGHEDSTNVELGYDQPADQSDQVHLEYEGDDQQENSGHIDSGHAEEHQGETYDHESDSESDEDSRHNRGKFISERTGKISLSAATEREAIPDTLEINDEQAAQIEEFMSDKSTRGRGRGGRNSRGRMRAHNRLGNRPNPGEGPMFRGPRMGLMDPRLLSPPGGPRGPGMPRGMMGPRGPFRGMRPQMSPRGPVMGGVVNPLFAMGRGQPPFPGMHQERGRFPGEPIGPRGPLSMIGPGALLEPMKQLLQNMRGPQPGNQRMPGQAGMQGPGSMLAMRMGGPRGLRPGMEPRSLAGAAGPMGPNRMMRPPQSPGMQRMMGALNPTILAVQQNQMRLAQPNRGRLPPHQRLGRIGPANQGVEPRGMFPGGPTRPPFMSPPGQDGPNKIFINPLFQRQQGGPSGITRTVKMGVPVQQRRAKALLEKAKQNKQPSSLAVAPKRKSTGGDELSPKVIKREVKSELGEEESSRVVEKKEPVKEETGKISSLLEEQKRKREMIQRRKELARQRQAEEKRKLLGEKMSTEGNKIESIVGRGNTSDKRTVEKSGDAASIKVVSRSLASRLGPPPESNKNVSFQNRGPQAQQIRGPSIRGPQPQQMRWPQQQIRGPPPSQQFRGPAQQQPRGPQPQQLRGPPPRLGGAQQQVRNQQMQQLRGPPPQQQNIRGPPPQRFGGLQQQGNRGPVPQQQQIGGPRLQQQIRGPPPQQQQIRGPPPQQQQIRGPPPHQVITGPPPQQQQQIRGPPPQQQIRGPPPQQQIGGPGLQQQIRGPPPQQVRGPPPHQVIRGPPPQQQQIRGPPPQHQLRGPPPQQLRGPPPQSIRGPPPQQTTALVGVRPGHNQAPQVHGSPQYQTPPPAVGYVAPPPILTPEPRFSVPPQFQHNPQPAHSGYEAAAPAPSSFISGQHFSTGPPQQQQQHYGDPQFPPPSSGADSAPASYGYSTQPPPQQPASYQQNYAPPPQQEYSQPAAPVYSAQYQATVHTPAQQTVASSYQYSQPEAVQYSDYGAHQTAAYPAYQNTSPAPQQSYQYTQDTSYHHSTDYSAHTQPVMSVTSQASSSLSQDPYDTSVGQKIQTIGQRIQPVTGTQMRSIIHNVTSPTQHSSSQRSSSQHSSSQHSSSQHSSSQHSSTPHSSTPQRSVQHRTPTLHISRAVMEGNVPVLAGSQKVIILNVPQMATRETLIKLCRHFGHVEGVNLMRDQNKAVVQFQKGEQAAKCVSKCDQKCLHKTRLTVKLLPS